MALTDVRLHLSATVLTSAVTATFGERPEGSLTLVALELVHRSFVSDQQAKLLEQHRDPGRRKPLDGQPFLELAFLRKH